MSGKALLVAACVYASAAIGQPATNQPRLLRLVCDGETGPINDDSKRKRERKTVQLTINLVTGVAAIEGLSIFATGAVADPPVFTTTDEAFHIHGKSDQGNPIAIFDIKLDRYSGLLREFQGTHARDSAQPAFYVTGEYHCARLDKPAF